MTDRPQHPWPFAPSLRFSSMALLAVVLSTFITGWGSSALLAAGAALTIFSVVRFLQALRAGKPAVLAHAPEPGEDLRSKDYV
jgi:hypothetical protein